MLVVLYARIFTELVSQWLHDANYSHGFIVPFFCAWVLWRERKRYLDLPAEGSWFGFIVVLGSLLLLILGVLGAENFLARTSFLFLVAGLMIFFQGWKFFRAVLFPWAAAFLMVPLPAIIFNQIAVPLQFQASQLASGLLGLVGVPVLREGNVIRLPYITLDVVEACSGLRSLVSLITLAVIFGYLFESRVSKRVLLVLLSVPIAMIANAFRIMGSGLIGEYWSPDKAEGFFHTFSGLIIFVVAFVLLLFAHYAISGFRLKTSSKRPA